LLSKGVTMPKLTSAVVAAAVVVCIGLPVVLVTAVFGGAGGGCATMPTSRTVQAADRAWDAQQVSVAAVIVEVGRARAISRWGWVVALATAMQESRLRNLPHLGPDNDHDSVGVFQQRPSQGWGTVEQLADSAYQAGKFYDKLVIIPGWQSMPLTRAAQAVQVSAYPDAYEKWTAPAILLADRLGAARPTDAPGGVVASCGSLTGWVKPVDAPIVSGFRTAGRPDHDGVDLGAARGTPIRAAGNGTVIVVRCNVSPASRGCDRDGSPQVAGCGWYVDIRHVEGVITRYCHMLSRPAVSVGQYIVAGQAIGLVGSSGNSSGPHLHFEVHLRNDRSTVGAIDPVAFMAAAGASLGT
jgi:murein DD-endopeptidase MepM/ murein hydrolase activator NlpD